MSLEQEKLYVEGGQNEEVPSHLNFGKFMFDNIRLGRDEVALHNVISNEKYTYKELTQEVVDLSIGFLKLGMGKGDVVFIGIDTMSYIPTILAVIFTGATASPYFLFMGQATLKQRLETTSPTFIICNERCWINYGDVLKDIKTLKAVITSDEVPKSAIPMTRLIGSHNDVNEFVPTEVQGDKDVAVIHFSSGTSGISKAIQLTHVNCLFHSLANDYKSFTTGLFCRPWAINYYDFKTFMFLANRKKMIQAEVHSAENILSVVENYKIDVLFCMPSLVYELANFNCVENFNLRSLKVIHSRSAPLGAEIIKKIHEIFPPHVQVVQAYGMTECGELASGIRVLNRPKGLKHGSVGIPSRGMIIKVINPQTGESLPPNSKGEICVKGAGFMKGYIGIDPSTYLDEEDFFKTSDLGFFDADGYLYVIDRLKDIMIYKCLNIAPALLENMLQLHPGVKEAGVVGKPHPAFGDLPTAFVVKQPGSEVTERELKDYIFKEMSPIQLEGGVNFISKLPRNERGKVLRRELKAMLNQV